MQELLIRYEFNPSFHPFRINNIINIIVFSLVTFMNFNQIIVIPQFFLFLWVRISKNTPDFPDSGGELPECDESAVVWLLLDLLSSTFFAYLSLFLCSYYDFDPYIWNATHRVFILFLILFRTKSRATDLRL